MVIHFYIFLHIRYSSQVIGATVFWKLFFSVAEGSKSSFWRKEKELQNFSLTVSVEITFVQVLSTQVASWKLWVFWKKKKQNTTTLSLICYWLFSFTHVLKFCNVLLQESFYHQHPPSSLHCLLLDICYLLEHIISITCLYSVICQLMVFGEVFVCLHLLLNLNS